MAELAVDIWHQSVSNLGQNFMAKIPPRVSDTNVLFTCAAIPGEIGFGFLTQTRFYHVVSNLWNWSDCVADI